MTLGRTTTTGTRTIAPPSTIVPTRHRYLWDRCSPWHHGGGRRLRLAGAESKFEPVSLDLVVNNICRCIPFFRLRGPLYGSPSSMSIITERATPASCRRLQAHRVQMPQPRLFIARIEIGRRTAVDVRSSRAGGSQAMCAQPAPRASERGDPSVRRLRRRSKAPSPDAASARTATSRRARDDGEDRRRITARRRRQRPRSASRRNRQRAEGEEENSETRFRWMKSGCRRLNWSGSWPSQAPNRSSSETGLDFAGHGGPFFCT